MPHPAEPPTFVIGHAPLPDQLSLIGCHGVSQFPKLRLRGGSGYLSCDLVCLRQPLSQVEKYEILAANTATA